MLCKWMWSLRLEDVHGGRFLSDLCSKNYKIIIISFIVPDQNMQSQKVVRWRDLTNFLMDSLFTLNSDGNRADCTYLNLNQTH